MFMKQKTKYLSGTVKTYQLLKNTIEKIKGLKQFFFFFCHTSNWDVLNFETT